MNPNFRKEFINILLKIRRKYSQRGTGSIIPLLQEKKNLKIWPDLSGILEGIDWAVIGAVGLRLYIPERHTADLDIAINKKDAGIVRERFKKGGFEYKGELSVGGSCWLSKERIPIDVVECSQLWVEEAIKEAKKNRDPQGLRIMPFEYLVLMKFTSGRPQDIADITRMLGLADEEKINKTRKAFKNWLPPEDLEDLESLIFLARCEIEGR